MPTEFAKFSTESANLLTEFNDTEDKIISLLPTAISWLKIADR